MLGAARELFAAEGYSGVSTEELVRRAGVTRGALYHHFADKRDLFRALVEELEEELEELVLGLARAAREKSGDAGEAFAAGFVALLDACARPEFGRVLFVDGPSALGWEECLKRRKERMQGASREALLWVLGIADFLLLADSVRYFGLFQIPV